MAHAPPRRIPQEIVDQIIDHLLDDGHILTSRSVDTLAKTAAAIAAGGQPVMPTAQAQKICLLALCGIHLGPLRYLKTSSLLQPYIQVGLFIRWVIARLESHSICHLVR